MLLLRLSNPAGEIQLKLPPESLLFLSYSAAGGEGVGLEGWVGRRARVRRRVMFLSIYYVLSTLVGPGLPTIDKTLFFQQLYSLVGEIGN